MKKAFDQNVSRARPRLRLGALTEVADAAAAELPPQEAEVAAPPPPAASELGAQVKARAERGRAPKPSASEAVERALGDQAMPRAQGSLDITPAAVHTPEVQTPAPELPSREHAEPADSGTRRDRLKERLRAVRENPNPEPLPPTVAAAGVLAVERIETLQTELHKVKALNLALTQDLESARRQAEKATEEARLRMDESRRLSQEMEGRVRLLQDLERELSALEGERDEALLSLQESRQGLAAADGDKQKLEEEIARRDASLAESLAEEERLCSELEASREDGQSLRRAVESLSAERDILARQVSELTAERAELLEARKALEAVHRALSTAAAR